MAWASSWRPSSGAPSAPRWSSAACPSIIFAATSGALISIGLAGSALLKVAKNALGVLLVLLGVVLSLPGVPGQGLLTILIGLILLDLPGKQRFERRLMTRPAVFTAVNTVRARFGREPLLPPLHAS